MPEVRFSVRWPDGTTELCYSPSLVIKEHLSVGEIYSLPDFLARTTTALKIGSDRIKAKYGYPCSRAMAQLSRIEAVCGTFCTSPGGVYVDEFVE